MAEKKNKILFVSEAATLAHVARPLALSASLDRGRYELAIACAERCHWLLRDFPGEKHTLDSVDSAHFLEALAKGKPVYDTETLRRYVRDDLALLDKVRPDVVVGDFRLSLSISARLARVPYVAISNCYWSPYWRPSRYPVPNLPITRALPLSVAELLFQVARPVAFALHCRPMNRARRHYGLPSLGSDLRRVYTDADHVFYADIAELFSDAVLPTNHRFLGPVIWAPPVPLPPWWNQVPDSRPIVYLTLGSSGQAVLFSAALRDFSKLDVTIIAATAGSPVPDDRPSNAYIADYLPGTLAARRATLVICNGGSPTSQQALAAGVPVLGIVDNLDQHLNMWTLARYGVGEKIRSDRFQLAELRELTMKMLNTDSYRQKAAKLADACIRHSSANPLAALLERLIPSNPL